MTRVPVRGQMWQISGPSGFGICLGNGYWSVLVRNGPEYTLTDTLAPFPVRLEERLPRSMAWADQFDALAAAEGLDISWADEVHRYRELGLAKTTGQTGHAQP
ncbi:hypothetical protein [Arthrobacter caoxuetaonis]|uniref:Uncharacterized protein n=1 Tax=Arthrobacter caoxuetaonis TaxID=2886935 RepID=A0A9X1MJ42_9MICC|nr:hypothetical protein [Arthrobacter caoxuetaonis]MCC3299479.1 hypothetical protein [Arthrobacter caoxuetaonis]USQ59029.1 hypothetical protein NF551_18155 [Arthrobacter caoxuetaonis]